MASRIDLLVATLFFSSCLVLQTQQYEFGDLFIHADSDARIVGGSPVDSGRVPYMVALSTGHTVRNFVCGASLISIRHVLTAAHCVISVYNAGNLSRHLRIIVGTNSWREGGRTYNVTRNLTHPDFDLQTITNDIGVLVASSEVKFSSKVQPVHLSYDFIGAGVSARITGWGLTKTHGAVSPVLLELIMATIDGLQCVSDVNQRASELGGRVPVVEPTIELCVYHSAGHGVCNGDSGSPLVQVSNGKQIGVVSWGLPCALGAPDMFTRVSAYQNWIQKVTATRK